MMPELALLRFEAFVCALRLLRAAKSYAGDPAYTTVGGKRVRL